MVLLAAVNRRGGIMKFVNVLVAMLLALSATDVSTRAQGRGNGQAKKAAVSAPKAKAPAPSQHTAGSTTKQTAKADTRAAKAAAKADTRAVKAETKAARKADTTTIPTFVTPTTPTTHHVKNPKLEARLLTLLPPGSTIQDASLGFKNWGQFVAAAHVSNNLGIPFAELKARMTGIPAGTPPGTTVLTTPMSLGQAIQSFKGTPTMDTATFSSTRVRDEVKKAEDAANTDLRRSRERS
jgi:hypothetical protein